ncbi:hypothetical protein [Streptococcus gallolyticus]|uniref:hypothetical protein n=1 Tax=Streptococcus gallolyticus TaxID=315405 RepID=UPI002283324B|nr:hypothetical protein [Streptococcus gallolyticus]MCY7187272.1 hypothetical protein [Streptococcus gallolyticus subsp. gallolyticus]
MLTMYNLVTESNYKDVINKMAGKGYPMINGGLSTKFPKENGDVFLRSGFNNYNQQFESVFTTRAIEKQNGIKLPSGDKKFQTFVVDKMPASSLMGANFTSDQKGLWSVEKEVVPNEESKKLSPQHYEEELMINSEGATAFEALKEGLSHIMGDLSKEDLEELPFLANQLERDHVVTHAFDQEWGKTITTVRKTNLFRLINEYNDWFRPFIVDYRSQGKLKEVFFDFSYNYPEMVKGLCKSLSASVKEVEEMTVYLPYCTLDGVKTGEMLSTYPSLRKAYDHALYLDKVLGKGAA